MSKSITRKISYMSLLENSLTELFSPSSKKALFNYKDLQLLNTKELALIDMKQLKLIDPKQLELLNIAALLVFFEYLGALFLTLTLGFMLSFGAFTLHNNFKSTVLAEVGPTVPVDNVATYKAELVREERAESSRSSFAALIDSQPVESTNKVLGVSTLNSCSFRAVEGQRAVLVSDGGRYSSTKTFKLCVDSNQAGSVFNWDLGSETSSTSSNCVTSSELSGLESVSVTLTGETGEALASCDVSLVRNLVASAN